MLVKPNLYLTYGGFILFLILRVIYLKDKKLNTVREKLFNLIMICVGLFLITDIINIPINAYDMNIIIKRVCWIGHWSFCLIGCYLLFLYTQYLCLKIPANKINDVIKYNKTNIIITIITLISLLIYIFVIEYVPFDLNTMIFTHMSKTWIIEATMILHTIINLIVVYKHRNDVSPKERLGFISIAIIFIVGSLFQFNLRTISIIPVAYTLLVFGLYFNSENPNLRLIETLNIRKGNVSNNDQKKSKVINEVVTNIKDPLKNINEICNELKKEHTEVEYKKLFNLLDSEGNNLMDIANKSYELSDNKNEEYYIEDIINESIGFIKEKCKSKEVNLKLEIDETLPSKYLGDSNKLISLLEKILSYSINNTTVGKIVFSIKLINGNTLFIKITDSGNGITKEQLPNALEYNGVYDISIYKEYLDAIGAKVWVDSTHHAGSKFYLQLPQTITDKTPIKDSIKEEVVGDNDTYLDFAGSKLLLVCDSKSNTITTKRLLSKYNVIIDSVYTREDCIYKIKENKKYDAILLDLKNIEESNKIAKSSIKLKDDFNVPPLILISTNNKYEEGFTGYIEKPMKIKNINKVLRKVLKENK